jgi:hypothetical protein
LAEKEATEIMAAPPIGIVYFFFIVAAVSSGLALCFIQPEAATAEVTAMPETARNSLREKVN